MIEGTKAPEFSLFNDEAQKVSLESLIGKNLVLYFYPKDDTPGCTKEAQDFGSIIDELKNYNTLVFGISKDNINSHTAFKKKHSLPFYLLADESTGMLQNYGVWKEKSMFGKKYMGIERTTFLVDKTGVIRKIWPKVKIAGHANAVLKSVEELCTE